MADWKTLTTLQPPDPLVGTDWNKVKDEVGENRRKGLLTEGSGGRFFDRLHFLRGLENLMIDFASKLSSTGREME